MYRDRTVAVVVPAYNEGAFVGDVIETIPPLVDRIYAVDDGSTDDTWEEIRRAAAAVNDEPIAADGGAGFERRVVPLQHAENRGVGGAIKTGYLRARDDGVDATVVMGGDGQMQPELLERLLDPIVDGEADYVKGNRLTYREDRAGMPRFRYVGNVLLSWLTRVASGYWAIGDPQNGYTAVSRRALETIAVEDLYEFYGYCNELLVRLSVHGLRVVDVKRPSNYAEEESHIRLSTYVPRVSAMLLRSFLWRLATKYRLHPVTAAYGLAGAGGLWALVATARRRGPGRVLGALLASALAFVAGAVLDARENADLNERRFD